MSGSSERPDQHSPLPDQDQRDLILNVLDRNMLVEAAAGTGKTTSMACRMVALLGTGTCADIAAMAAVTFTRKAAAELKARFRVSLEKAVREAEGDRRERLHAALERIDQCYVGTIHSFCARLLRERPIEAGIDLAFQEIEEDADNELRQEAWSEFISIILVDDPDGILTGLEEVGIEPRDLADAFQAFCSYPDIDEWPLPRRGNEPAGLEETGRELERYLAHLERLLPELPSLPGKTDTLVPAIYGILRAHPHYDNLADPRQLAELLRKFDAEVKVVKTAWDDADRATGELDRWREFRESVAAPFLISWREFCYEPVIRAMFGARAIYDALRLERGYLNYQDLLMKAAALLRENPHVRRYLGERFTHLLIDEFQDTDPIQAEVLFLLADEDTETSGRDWRKSVPRPGSLFLVGDPKQSIYRFRRADIVTYNRVKEKIIAPDSTGQPGLPVRLSTNFRTIPAIIDWVNGVFGPKAEDEDESAACRFPATSTEQSPDYVALEYGRPAASEAEFCGVFRLDIPADRAPGDKAYGKLENAMEYEADLIARAIRRAVNRKMTIPRSSGDDPAGYSDFMIIARRTKKLDVYARKLQQYGIPHEVAGGSSLSKLEELRLFYKCLRAVVRTDDPVALVATLRSELFGLSDVQLFRFKKAGGSFSFYSTVPESLEEADREAFGGAFTKLRDYASLLSQLPALPALERIAADLGLLVLAASRPGGDVEAGSLVKAIEILRAAREGTWSTAQLIEILGELTEGGQDSDSLSVLSREKPLVRVLNLHKAKGLEAPVVFLAEPAGGTVWPAELHIDRTGEKTKGYVLFSRKTGEWSSEPLAQPAEWEDLASREAAFLAAENLRLLYVAATRAGSALIVTQRSKGGASRNPWNVFDPFIPSDRQIENPGPQEPEEKKAIVIGSTDPSEAETRMAERMELCHTPTYEARAAKEYALEPGPAETVEPSPEPITSGAAIGQSEHGFEWGSVIHALLDLVAKDPEADLIRAAEVLLPEYELDPSLARDAAEVAVSVTQSAIWLRARGSELCLTEAPFVIQLKQDGLPTILRGAIDMAFREGDGWVLVDYKTDNLSGSSAESLARKYAPQLLLYRQAWEECTGEFVAEVGFYFTNNSSYVQIPVE